MIKFRSQHQANEVGKQLQEMAASNSGHHIDVAQDKDHAVIISGKTAGKIEAMTVVYINGEPRILKEES